MRSSWIKHKSRRWIIAGMIVCLSGIFLLTHLADSFLIRLIHTVIQRNPKPTWSGHLGTTGIGLFLLGILIILFDLYLYQRLRAFIQIVGRKINTFEDRLELGLSPYLSLENPSQELLAKLKKVNWVDILVVLFFLLIALFMFLNKIQSTYPHIIMGGDAGNIISFAAALDHPEYFKGDALLNNLNNFSIYATINIPLIRWLNQFTGDYGLAFSYLLIPQIFIQLLGFYLLGRVLFKSQLWAFLFTFLVSMPFEINLEETWGVTLDPVSRYNFQALLPYLLVLAYLWRDKPRRWPWIMICAGLLVFVHPVSTPAWGLALWLGFIPFLPIGWNRWKRMAVMLGLGALFLAATSPFVLNYLSHHIQGKSADYKLVYYIIVNNFPKNLLNVPAAMLTFLSLMFKTGILPGSIVGLLILWFVLRHDRSPLQMVLFWILGILLASVFLPWMEQSIERFYRIIPIETELVRGIRYLVFFMLMFCLWPLAELSGRLKSRYASGVALAVGILVMGLWMLEYNPNILRLRNTVDCLTHGRLVCISLSNDASLLEAIQTRTPQDARFFASFANDTTMTFALTIRSTALRSLVYTFKDRGMMVYSNNQALNSWFETYQEIEQNILINNGNYLEQFRNYLDLAKKLGADYLVIDFPPPPDALQKYPLELVFQNPTYTLYKIRAP